jgi:hypothetical protein
MGFFLIATASWPALGPIQIPIQWIRGTGYGGGGSFSEVKQQRRVADHLPPSSDEIKDAWSNTSIPQIYLHVLVIN